MSSMPPDPSDREQRAEIELFSNGEFHLQMLPDGQDGFRVLAPEVARALAFRDAYRLMESIPAEEKGYTTAELPCSHYHPRTGELVLDPPQVRVTVKGLGWLHQHLGGAAPLAIDGGPA